MEVNKQLDKMGYNIGLRLIEDYLAKSNTMKRCVNFRETADMIARVSTRDIGLPECAVAKKLGRLDLRSSSTSRRK